MRILAVLYLIFLFQASLADGTPTLAEEPSETGRAAKLIRRKRGWGWSSSPSNKATKRPIGWSFGDTQELEQKPKRRPVVQAVPVYNVAPVYSVAPAHVHVHFGRPTKSLTRTVVGAAFAIGAVSAVKAFSKPVEHKPLTAQQRSDARERRRQQRLSRSTTVAPSNETISTTPAVPLATSDLIPVMVQDVNRMFQVAYVPRDKIPPGAIPIMAGLPFQPQQPPAQPGAIPTANGTTPGAPSWVPPSAPVAGDGNAPSPNLNIVQ